VRRRLLAAMLGIAIACVLVLGVPLALLARHQVWTSARDRIREQAAAVATGIEDQLDANRTVDLQHFKSLMPDRRIVVRPPDGAVVVAGVHIDGPRLQATVIASDSTVTVQAAQGPTVTRARQVTLIVVGLSLLAAVMAIGLALWLARRVGRPIAELVERADALGHGTFMATPMASGVPEVDHVSEVLERSARRVGTVMDLQREFASDAAHQLRTPLTSIGLHLEELSRIGNDDARTEADDALAQVERLDTVITSLLARARGDSEEPALVDLGKLVSDGSVPWQRVLARRDRKLVLDAQPRVRVLARRAHLHSVMASLLDNAVTHGAGDVVVTVTRVGATAELRVRDGGTGVPPELAAHIFDRRVSGSRGTGIGLALAHALAAAESGSLELSGQSPAEFTLSVPLAPPDAGG
jgi:signal transduction histidine kinase